jgi:hypothetical protein
MSVLPTYGPARRSILTPYVMLWMAVASFALAYVALLGLSPHMLASVAQKGPDVDQKLAQTRRDMERGLADLDPLRRTVGEVKMDVANLKIAVQEASDRDRAILERVSTLQSPAVPQAQGAAQPPETRHTPAAMIPPPPRPDPRKSADAKAPVVTTAAKTPEVTAAAKAPVVTTVAAATHDSGSSQKHKSTNAIETGSITHAATSPPPAARSVNVPAAAKSAPAPAKPTPVGVLVATGPSLDSLRLNWSILTDRHADTVRNLHPRYVVTGGASKPTYGLVVGPLASTVEAKSLCKAMQSRGQACQVSAYRGNAL